MATNSTTRPQSSTGTPAGKPSKKHALKHTNLPVKDPKPGNGSISSKSSLNSDKNDDLYLAKLKSQFGFQLQSLSEIFSDWNDEDLVAVLQEVEGDLEVAITRISEGFAQQWSKQGKKTKKEAKKDSAVSPGASGVSSAAVQSSSAGAVHVASVVDSSLSSSSRSAHVPSARGRGRGGRGGSHARGGRSGATTNGSARESWSKVAAGASKATEKPQQKDNSTWDSASVTGRDWKSEWPKSSSQNADADSNWGDSSWKSETNSHADNWSIEASASTTSWADSAIVAAGPVISSTSSTPAPVVAQQTKPAVQPPSVPKPVKRGTWAEIAKPAEPPAPVVEKKKVVDQAKPQPTKSVPAVAALKAPRETSPKRYTEAATSVDSSPNRLVSAAISSQQQHQSSTAGVLFPPGLSQVKQPSRELSPALQRNTVVPKESTVVLPKANLNANNVGLTFGSLSLNKASEPLVGEKPSAAVNAVTVSGSLAHPSNSSSATSPVASQFFQQQTQTVGDFGTGIYANDRQTSSLIPDSSSVSQQQQQQQGMGYPPGMPPNMANMYAAAAAYFPIYMNHMTQFGGNPYAAAAPYPAQQSYGPTSASSNGSSSATKPAASTGAYSTGNIYSNTAATGQAQQTTAKPAPIPVSNPSGNIYNAYYGYSTAGLGGNVGGFPGTGLTGASTGGYDDYQNAYMSQYSTPQYQPQYQSQYGMKPSAASGSTQQSTAGASTAGGAYSNPYFGHHQYMPPHPAPSYPTFNSQAQNSGSGQQGTPRKNSTGASGRKAGQPQQQQQQQAQQWGNTGRN